MSPKGAGGQRRLPSSDGGSSAPSASALSSIALAQSIRWWDGDAENISAAEKQVLMRMAAGLETTDRPADSMQRRRQEEHVLRILAENEMLRSTVSAYRQSVDRSCAAHDALRCAGETGPCVVIPA